MQCVVPVLGGVSLLNSGGHRDAGQAPLPDPRLGVSGEDAPPLHFGPLRGSRSLGRDHPQGRRWERRSLRKLGCVTYRGLPYSRQRRFCTSPSLASATPTPRPVEARRASFRRSLFPPLPLRRRARPSFSPSSLCLFPPPSARPCLLPCLPRPPACAAPLLSPVCVGRSSGQLVPTSRHTWPCSAPHARPRLDRSARRM